MENDLREKLKGRIDSYRKMNEDLKNSIDDMEETVNSNHKRLDQLNRDLELSSDVIRVMRDLAKQNDRR